MLQRLELRHPSEGDLQAVPCGKGQKDGVAVGRWGGKCGRLGFLLTRYRLPSRHSPLGGFNLSRKALLISFPFLFFPSVPSLSASPQWFPRKFPTLLSFLVSSAEFLCGGWDGMDPSCVQRHVNGGNRSRSPGSSAWQTGHLQSIKCFSSWTIESHPSLSVDLIELSGKH